MPSLTLSQQVQIDSKADRVQFHYGLLPRDEWKLLQSLYLAHITFATDNGDYVSHPRPWEWNDEYLSYGAPMHNQTTEA
jgi:hypothetical protein